MHGGEEGVGAFGVTSGNSAPFFEIAKGVFHQVPQFVEVLIPDARLFAVFARRNLCLHALSRRLLDNGVAVISLVGDQMFGRQALNQPASLRTIRHGTRCNKDSDRHTMRIHGQMQFGVEPPFVRPIC